MRQRHQPILKLGDVAGQNGNARPGRACFHEDSASIRFHRVGKDCAPGRRVLARAFRLVHFSRQPQALVRLQIRHLTRFAVPREIARRRVQNVMQPSKLARDDVGDRWLFELDCDVAITFGKVRRRRQNPDEQPDVRLQLQELRQAPRQPVAGDALARADHKLVRAAVIGTINDGLNGIGHAACCSQDVLANDCQFEPPVRSFKQLVTEGALEFLEVLRYLAVATTEHLGGCVDAS